MQDDVRCTSGAFYAEEPRAFTWQGKLLDIETINARSHVPDGRLFIVSASDGRTYNLLYSEARDAWEVSPAGELPRPSPEPRNEINRRI